MADEARLSLLTPARVATTDPTGNATQQAMIAVGAPSADGDATQQVMIVVRELAADGFATQQAIIVVRVTTPDATGPGIQFTGFIGS